jgi:hypothetical protein
MDTKNVSISKTNPKEVLMITIVSMSRRSEMYRDFVEQIEKLMGELVDAYLVFVNDPQLLPFYKSLELKNSKVKVFNAPEDFVFKYGHDTVYNYIEKQVQSKFILKLFDTDTVEVNSRLLEQELKENFDIYGMETYMERGDVWETKYQLYKKGVIEWYGLVHENQHLKKGVIHSPSKILKNLKIYHHNALDLESEKVEKTPDGQFIILKKTQENTDSDRRNLLYETLAWTIANASGRHDNPGWFKKHYEINKEVIDWYYERARRKYKL